MTKIHEKVLERLHEIQTQTTGWDTIKDQKVRLLYYFFEDGLYNDLLNLGVEQVGLTFRRRGEMCLMILKARREGTQQVVFITGKKETACMQTFVKQMLKGTLKWNLDKYA